MLGVGDWSGKVDLPRYPDWRPVTVLTFLQESECLDGLESGREDQKTGRSYLYQGFNWNLWYKTSTTTKTVRLRNLLTYLPLGDRWTSGGS